MATPITTSPATRTATVLPIALRGNGFGTCAAVLAEVAPEHHVLRQAQRHPDGGRAEAPVEADAGLQQAGDQRADERAQVDAEIEQGEAAVGAGIALLVKGAQQRRGVGFQRARAQSHATPDRRRRRSARVVRPSAM